MAYTTVPHTAMELRERAERLAVAVEILREVAADMERAKIESLELWASRASDATILLWKWAKRAKLECELARDETQRTLASGRKQRKRH